MTGCKKEESVTVTETVTEAVSETGATLKETGEAVKANVEKAAAEVKEQVTAAVSNAPAIIDQAKTFATTEGTARAQTVIDKATALVTDKKYADALNSLQGLSGLKLTPEQQKLVDGLKAQIEKGMAGLKLP